MIIVIIIGYVLIGLIEITPLVKNKKFRELSLYCVLFVSAFILSILLVLDVEITSPAVIIEKIVTSIIKL